MPTSDLCTESDCFEIFESFKFSSRLSFSNQVVTERLLEMLSRHLVNLLWMRIHECQHETVKPLAKFRNLIFVDFDFDPGRDELSFLFENSRTLDALQIHGKTTMTLLRGRRTVSDLKLYEEHKISILPNENCMCTFHILPFESLPVMIECFYEHDLFNKDWATSTDLLRDLNFET